MKVSIDSVRFEKENYPRFQFSNETVNAYRFAVDELPPIKLTKEMVLVDGYHRLLAHKLEGRTEIEATIEDIPIKDILWEATKENNAHGLQLSVPEKKELAREFYKGNHTQQEIGSALSVSNGTVSSWLSDLVTESREAQRKQIIDLHLQCLTQEEIASKIGLTQERIGQIIRKFETEEISNVNLVPDSLQLFNVWTFSNRAKEYGLAMEGAIPGQIVENILYYFTKPFDTVVDPMAGSGTTIDVCKKMFRRYRAYDLKPLREDIVQHDIQEGYPKECLNADLIFLDPPYFNMVFNLHKTINDFYLFVEILAKQSWKTVKEDGKVAYLMQDMTEKGNHCLSGESYRIFRDIGFETIAHVSCPLTTEQFLPQQVNIAKKETRMLGRNRDLYIFRRP